MKGSDLETWLEVLCVELNLACSCKIVISAICRPPDSTPSYDFHFATEFTSHLNNSVRLPEESFLNPRALQLSHHQVDRRLRVFEFYELC